MGFFDFTDTDIEESEMVEQRDDSAQTVQEIIESNFQSDDFEWLEVYVDNDVVLLSGVAKDYDVRERAILVAGNIEGISDVNADELITADMIEPADNEFEEELYMPEEIFYTIEEGDTLWDIAEKFYGDGHKYREIVMANPDVIENEDLIYVGDTIRIPDVE